ncbi:hypothetical protein ACHAWF_010981 [Thalassiosira exigua]
MSQPLPDEFDHFRADPSSSHERLIRALLEAPKSTNSFDEVTYHPSSAQYSPGGYSIEGGTNFNEAFQVSLTGLLQSQGREENSSAFPRPWTANGGAGHKPRESSIGSFSASDLFVEGDFNDEFEIYESYLQQPPPMLHLTHIQSQSNGLTLQETLSNAIAVCQSAGAQKSVMQHPMAQKMPALELPQETQRHRRQCSAPACPNRVVQGGLCISHGAKRRKCRHPGCDKNVKKAGLCSTHGPARKRCEVEGCIKVAVQAGRCISHGAKKKSCSVDACTKQAIIGGMCKRHYDQTNGIVKARAKKGFGKKRSDAEDIGVNEEIAAPVTSGYQGYGTS